MSLNGAVQFCHLLLKEIVRPGDRVADATCGNGHDTLFLAGLVGPAGKVWAFDVQEAAVSSTRALLSEASLLGRVELVNGGHETISDAVPDQLRAVVFNLGYLPGSDKTLITRPETTILALKGAAQILLSGGMLMIVAYTGHAGGGEEALAVEEWASTLPSGKWQTWRCNPLNRQPNAPYLIVIEKSE